MYAIRILPLVTGLALAVGTVTAMAHHGRAAYTQDVITLEATVTEFRFINPHVQLYFDITNEAGEVERWQGELTAPNRLARGGWTKTIFEPGDKLTLTGLAARNDGKAILIQEIILPSGDSVPLRETL